MGGGIKLLPSVCKTTQPKDTLWSRHCLGLEERKRVYIAWWVKSANYDLLGWHPPTRVDFSICVSVKDNCLLYTDCFFIIFLKLCHFLPLKLLTSMINYLFIPFMYSHCSFPYMENMQLSSSILVSLRYYCSFISILNRFLISFFYLLAAVGYLIVHVELQWLIKKKNLILYHKNHIAKAVI